MKRLWSNFLQIHLFQEYGATVYGRAWIVHADFCFYDVNWLDAFHELHAIVERSGRSQYLRDFVIGRWFVANRLMSKWSWFNWWWYWPLIWNGLRRHKLHRASRYCALTCTSTCVRNCLFKRSSFWLGRRIDWFIVMCWWVWSMLNATWKLAIGWS